MANPYAPPQSRVVDHAPVKAGWGRVILAILVGSGIALLLAWIVVPRIVGTSPKSSPLQLLTDVMLSAVAFFLGSLLSARVARGRPYSAALGVTAVGIAVYWSVMGGIGGLFSGMYPLWYQFFPAHWVPGLLAGWIASRSERTTA
jgi:hypothetical protein